MTYFFQLQVFQVPRTSIFQGIEISQNTNFYINSYSVEQSILYVASLTNQNIVNSRFFQFYMLQM